MSALERQIEDGGCLVSPGGGFSFTFSPKDVSTGWNEGGQVALGLAFQQRGATIRNVGFHT